MFRFPGEDDVTRSGYWLAPFLLLGAVASAAAQSPMPKSEVSGTPSVSGFYANSWALVIGINRYERALGLAYAVADAKAVAEALPPLGFPQQNVRLLLDGEATKTRIETVLYEEFAAMASQDRLLVFFAGHGETAPIKGGEEGYLLPVDANPAALARTAIPMDDLKRIGQRVKAKHVLFVMDASFSGFAATRDIAPTSTADDPGRSAPATWIAQSERRHRWRRSLGRRPADRRDEIRSRPYRGQPRCRGTSRQGEQGGLQGF